MKPLQLLCMFLIVAFEGITAQDFKEKIAQTTLLLLLKKPS